jgi:hypothetical protein
MNATRLGWLGLILVAGMARLAVAGESARTESSDVTRPTIIQLQAVRDAGLVSSTATRLTRAQRKNLLEIRIRTQERVGALSRELSSLDPNSPEWLAAQRRVAALKRDGEVEFLRARIGFANARGALTEAHAAEVRLQRMLQPRPIPPQQTEEPATTAAKLAKTGGRP